MIKDGPKFMHNASVDTQSYIESTLQSNKEQITLTLCSCTPNSIL